MAINKTHPIGEIDKLHGETSARLHTNHLTEKELHNYLKEELIKANEEYTRLQFEQANIMTISIVASFLGVIFAPFENTPWNSISKGVDATGQFLSQLKKAELSQIEGARNLIQIKMKEQTANKDHILSLIRSVDQAVEEAKRYMHKADGAFFN
jgi:hypothetical protein